MCNFTCAISKRGGVSAQNPRIQGRNCEAWGQGFGDRLQIGVCGQAAMGFRGEEGDWGQAAMGGGDALRKEEVVRCGVGPTYLHKRGHSRLFLVIRDRLQIGVCEHFVTGGGWVCWRVGWRGTRPARAEEARGRKGVRSAPTGHRIPARGETPGSGNWGQVSRSGLAADELGVHAGVNASLGDEAFVAAAFDDATVVEDEN